jgi:hypothetical protein
MKAIILALVLIFVLPSESDVYICVSKTASKYHLSESCKGLSRCTHTISKVSLSDANKRGYTLCGFED